uniref:Uncharacterized protein n=1 Tax=Sphaerodactylus townsendi TaxID=933632 RepID=A0ACB8FMK6_9SAUR
MLVNSITLVLVGMTDSVVIITDEGISLDTDDNTMPEDSVGEGVMLLASVANGGIFGFVIKIVVVAAASEAEETQLLVVAPASSVITVEKRSEDVNTGVVCKEVNHEVLCVSFSEILLVKTGSETELDSTSVGMVSSMAKGVNLNWEVASEKDVASDDDKYDKPSGSEEKGNNEKLDKISNVMTGDSSVGKPIREVSKKCEGSDGINRGVSCRFEFLIVMDGVPTSSVKVDSKVTEVA